MRHISKSLVVALFVLMTTMLVAGHQLLAADKTAPAAAKSLPYKTTEYSFTSTQNGPPPATAKPLPRKTTSTMEKLECLGTQLGRALDVAVDLLSNNEADLLSGNKTALLSGNTPTILSGNAPKVLSENTTPILSGNTFSMFSNIKIEIHIENSGNNAAAGPAVHPYQLQPIIPNTGPVPSQNPRRGGGGSNPQVQPGARSTY